MNPYTAYLNNLVNLNREKFSRFSGIRWLNPYQAAEFREKRDMITAGLQGSWLFKETKPFYSHLSPGCKLCGEGVWSCLFITNKCNAGCFYCPSLQVRDEVPATQSLTFESAESYAGYINFFGFRGVSFSGGEPLLFFVRTLHYLKTVRKMCPPDIYIWLYTNGILADRHKLEALADAGLNEIRFDIGATNYRLDNVKRAMGIIPVITIEVPAIPEKKEMLKEILPEMAEAGVTHLNLHQLRLTLHNAPRLIPHRYTIIPAEQPIVLESELAALEILNFASENNLNTGVNFCSFFFKNRFQPAGFRKLLAEKMAKPGSVITEKGFIREYEGRSLSYKSFGIADNKVAGCSCTELQLPGKTCFLKTESALHVQAAGNSSKDSIDRLMKTEPNDIPDDEVLFKVWQMEYIEKGLREY